MVPPIVGEGIFLSVHLGNMILDPIRATLLVEFKSKQVDYRD